MEIRNAKIKNANINFFGTDNLSARLEFAYPKGSQHWSFRMTKPTDVQRFMKLREYVEAENVEEMNGKIVRIVSFSNHFQGFGHPLEDKFIYCGHKEVMEVKELTESELKVEIEVAHGMVQPKKD